MDLEKRIIAFAKLGEILRTASRLQRGSWESENTLNSILYPAIQNASKHNGWFTEANVLLAIGSIGEMLREDKIRKWVSNYPQLQTRPLQTSTRVGVIMAGNIPLVGFHDFLCVLMSGNIFVGKLSSEDEYLLPAIADILCQIEPGFKANIHLTPTLSKGEGAARANFSPFGGDKRGGIGCFIATGSNNSARYFEYYFGKYPHVIRKNRNSIAILDDTETETDLKNLGKDIFQYFGMGCRNVSKIYIPKNYNLDTFFSAIVDFGDVINHNKYYNNHHYYHTIYLLSKEKFLDNNFLMLKESISLSSPVATLYYEYYKDQKDLTEKLISVKEQIQCITCNKTVPFEGEWATVPFGQAQSPELWDYADGVDTMEFLLSL